MKTINKEIYEPFSDEAIACDMDLIRNNTNMEPWGLTLTVSVFDAAHAVTMMIDKSRFAAVRYVHITPEFKESQYSLSDDLNGYSVASFKVA